MPQYLSDSDYQNYGGELVNFSQRAALEAVAPHLQNLEQENQHLRHWVGVEARHRMDAAVERAVPNYREIDADPRWHNWLLGTDALSGRVRQTLLNDAISSGAVNRVISFFRQFQNQAVGQASYYGTAPASGAVYTRESIKALYDARRRGAYAGREQEWQRQEADIFRAQREGRVSMPDWVGK